MVSARKPESFVWTIMGSNCCCDSHSTTRWVSCKKGSISSVARSQAEVRHCCCRRSVQRSEARGRAVGWICLLHENARALSSDFSTLRPGFKKCIFRSCIYRIYVDDQPKQCKTCVFTRKSGSVTMWWALDHTGSTLFARSLTQSQEHREGAGKPGFTQRELDRAVAWALPEPYNMTSS